MFVPVPVPSLRRTLGDAARVARCVPGLQQDADASAGPLSGRLKVRIDGHTITYRGVLELASRGDDIFSVAGEGVEARGAGSAKLSLTLTLTETGGGTTIEFAGTAGGDGRIAELEDAAALAAAHRLLDRFTRQLVTESLAGSPQDPAGPSPESAEAVTDRAEPLAPDGPGAGDELAPGYGSGYDAPVPPSSLDPLAEVEFTVPDGPPAEAAHARRTMIGRSTEEVDHAPPRGRYAPVPAPDAAGPATTLRWIAPAAALALVSAVVVGRALRRRR
ncbi:hypothetical protein Sfulv_28180 [Streptomyces fulvorobeus]|uniref:Carbon monoxide dehydrogenase subunit G n=1 Tax=Streptomyces fulvorobeus TaxID=284028 RepID=A0A7J0C774_9ACTN|nr:hypothetical protein Sfulv_28180 [Streptomyces fulvorobeus]